MVAAGLVDASGRLVAPDAPGVPPGLAARLRQVGQERVFVLRLRATASEPDDPAGWLYLSQRDIRELQFAKAAIATGWTLLLEEQGLTAADVAQVLLAGSFGSYLSPASAVRIGLVPDVALLRIVSAGNVAGEGAKMALLSLRERAAAQALLEEVHYVELSDRADFNDRFVDRLAFPGLTAGLPPAGRSPAGRVAVVACGAIARHVGDVAARRGWPVDVHPLPPLLHNRPERIAAAVERRVAGCGRGTRGWPWLRRLRHLRRAGRGVRPARGAAGCPAPTATSSSPAPSGCARCSRPSPAPTC